MKLRSCGVRLCNKKRGPKAPFFDHKNLIVRLEAVDHTQREHVLVTVVAAVVDVNFV